MEHCAIYFEGAARRHGGEATEPCWCFLNAVSKTTRYMSEVRVANSRSSPAAAQQQQRQLSSVAAARASTAPPAAASDTPPSCAVSAACPLFQLLFTLAARRMRASTRWRWRCS